MRQNLSKEFRASQLDNLCVCVCHRFCILIHRIILSFNRYYCRPRYREFVVWLFVRLWLPRNSERILPVLNNRAGGQVKISFVLRRTCCGFEARFFNRATCLLFTAPATDCVRTTGSILSLIVADDALRKTFETVAR